MSNMGLRGTTRPVTLEENRCCHHPSLLRDDEVLSPDRETPFHFRIQFRLLGPMFSGSRGVFAGLGEWGSGVGLWVLLLVSGFCV